MGCDQHANAGLDGPLAGSDRPSRSAEHVRQRIRRVRTDIRYLESQPGRRGNVLAPKLDVRPRVGKQK